MMQFTEEQKAAQPVYQFIANNPDKDGYVEWADCNPDYFSKEPSDRRRILYTAPPAPTQTAPDYSECPLCDSSYIAGMRAGFNFGDSGDNEGFNKAVNSRRKQISDSLNATAPQPVKVNLTGIMASFPAVGEGIYLEKAGVERAIRQAGGQVEG